MIKGLPLKVGIGGPVGAGKTSLTETLCRNLSSNYSMAVITNDIYTAEDAEYLMRKQVLPLERIRGIETGGCPHTAIREDASINLSAVEDLTEKIPDLDLILIESGGDNLAATFSPELADLTIYMIDVAMGEEIPRKGGPGITKSDILIINKIDLVASNYKPKSEINIINMNFNENQFISDHLLNILINSSNTKIIFLTLIPIIQIVIQN